MDIIGLLAAVLTTGCWLPQLARSWRTRSTADISWAYIFTFGLGISLWLTYGLVRADVPLIAANAAIITALAALSVMKVVFERTVPERS
ncbi:SemiSWEET family transporter [Allokutzneria sp. A3M-2-11 16]|uniref:SemiSWEET family sugar transporter n=1 Tax=Allokutzneria sp. A3M-2-11 16 TaxID=2962043 RepID=UPI0020B83395|nr:SemiSWEET family transporter [Allokutzneria sp. A3M-2-11 16]MCP3804643.1 SemiSWEET family transporter [Allokutzneria sp. A3M-2-11 16]